MNGGQCMAEYKRIIFVCRENLILSPMAEYIMKSILMDKTREIFSRGLVVLFAEPVDRKVTELLTNHAVPCEERVSQEFAADEVDAETLVLVMSFMEKVKLVEDYGLADNVFTLKEFAEDEEGDNLDPDLIDPYGGGDDAYEETYVELKDLLYKVKKKLQWN